MSHVSKIKFDMSQFFLTLGLYKTKTHAKEQNKFTRSVIRSN